MRYVSLPLATVLSTPSPPQPLPPPQPPRRPFPGGGGGSRGTFVEKDTSEARAPSRSRLKAGLNVQGKKENGRPDCNVAMGGETPRAITSNKSRFVLCCDANKGRKTSFVTSTRISAPEQNSQQHHAMGLHHGRTLRATVFEGYQLETDTYRTLRATVSEWYQ